MQSVKSRECDRGRFTDCAADLSLFGKNAGLQPGEMIVKLLKKCLSFVLSSCLLATTMPAGFADQSVQHAAQTPVQAAQQTPEQLQQLVAPIALYPDSLVAE